MQKVILLINPSDASKARDHLKLFVTGRFIVPSVFKIELQDNEIETAVNAFEYILTDVDFHFILLKDYQKPVELLKRELCDFDI
jgi:hypothetical protein